MIGSGKMDTKVKLSGLTRIWKSKKTKANPFLKKGLQVRGARQAGAEKHSSCIDEYTTRPWHPWG